MLGSMIFAGLMEGVGIAALLPLLSIVANKGGGSQTGIGRSIEEAIRGLGLEPSVGLMLLIVVLVITAKALLMLLAVNQIGYTAARVTKNLRFDLLRHLMRARWGFFVGQRSGSLSAALTSEPTRSATCYVQTAHMLTGVFQIAVYMGLAFAISWQVSAAALSVSVVSAILLNRFVVIAGRVGKEQNRLIRSLLSRLIDGLQAMKPIKAMGRESQLSPILEADVRALEHTQRRQIMSKEALLHCREPITAITLGAGLYVLLTQWNPELDSLLVMSLLFLRIVTKISGLQVNLQRIAGSLPAFWFIRSVMSTATMASESRPAGRPPALRHAIRLNDVNFAYGRKEVLHAVSVTIPAGSFVTIAGPSGSGKTTLVDIVVGLLRAQSGEVWIDDTEIGEIDLVGWRQRIGYVPQETVLFHDTVINNVTLRDDAISESRVVEALQMAGAWQFVREMPDGIHSIVGERGAQLSGGQRQRLAIARALVGNPDLLILDEATTALDPETEAAICATVRQLAGRMTIIAISHQRALQEAADILYRMEQGRLISVQSGNTVTPLDIVQ
jgi:ATP-binding cassette subfamily C protein